MSDRQTRSDPALDYVHLHRDPRRGELRCRVRVYPGGAGDAPVAVCEEPPQARGRAFALASGYIAAEVVRACFSEGLPDLGRPLLWIERYAGFAGLDSEHYLLTFPSYRPRRDGIGFAARITLGTPEREPLSALEVAVLTGERHPLEGAA